MIESIQGVFQRIQQARSRIEEIQKLGSFNRVEPVETQQVQPDELGNDANQQSFSDILKEAMGTQGAENPGLMGIRLDGTNQFTVGSVNESQALLESLYQNIQTGSDNIGSAIEEASQNYGVEEALIKAVIKQESQFNPNALSPAGAQGLMQLMPKTAELLNVSDPYDQKQNIMGGTKYLSMLMDKYEGNLVLSLAAYNAGSNRVDQAGGVPNISETQNYVKKVLQFYDEYRGLVE